MSTKAAQNKLPQTPVLLVDDNGYAWHKTAFYSGNKIITTKYPSIIDKSSDGYTDSTGAYRNRYITDDGVYNCPPSSSDALDIRTDDYATSTANRVLVTHCLAKTGNIGIPVRLGVTLPLRQFYKPDGAINHDRRDSVIKNFSTPVIMEPKDGPQANIIEVRAFAECMSAWFDWAIMEDGSANPAMADAEQTEMAIIDIGGQTTDICALMVDNGLVMNNKRSGTRAIGVLDAITAIQTSVAQEMTNAGVDISAFGNGIPRKVAEEILETGKTFYARRSDGVAWDFSALRDEVVREKSEVITNYIKQTLGQLSNYHTILVIGGGSIVFRSQLSKMLPIADFKDEFANARGALKYMRWIATQGQA